MFPDLDSSTLGVTLVNHADASHWYVGFSGGVDSTALLHLLQQWCRHHDGAPPLTAVHINHGLQGEAAQWERHCAALCSALQVPFLSLPAQVQPAGRGLEAAAREARYACFETLLAPGAVLFLGHHQDDQVETLMLRLLRGAGVDGLAAMPAHRPLGRGELCRPLLAVPRTALQQYVCDHGLACISDPSNADTGLDRNYLRAQVLPLLEARWPGYRHTLTRAAAHLAEAAGQLQPEGAERHMRYSTLGDPGLALQPLVVADTGAAARLVRSWLKRGGYPSPDRALLTEFLRQLRAAGNGSAPRLDCGSYSLQRYRDAVYLLPPVVPLPPLLPRLVPGKRVNVAGIGEVGLVPCADRGLRLDASDVAQLQLRRGGERCRPLGRGGSAPLKKVLQEAGVPPWWRDRVPLLVLGDTIAAIGQLGPCDSERWAGVAGTGETSWQLYWKPAVAPGFD